MHFPLFITRLADFWGFSFILGHFRVTTVLCKTILEAGVWVVIKLSSSMNAQSTGIYFIVDREHRGNPAWLTYSKLSLNAERNKITDTVYRSNISFSYWYQSEATPIADVLPQSPSPEFSSHLEYYTFSLQRELTCGELPHMH